MKAKITKIISVIPEEMRSEFEDAAGQFIAKFLKDKQTEINTEILFEYLNESEWVAKDLLKFLIEKFDKYGTMHLLVALLHAASDENMFNVTGDISDADMKIKHKVESCFWAEENTFTLNLDNPIKYGEDDKHYRTLNLEFDFNHLIKE